MKEGDVIQISTIYKYVPRLDTYEGRHSNYYNGMIGLVSTVRSDIAGSIKVYFGNGNHFHVLKSECVLIQEETL